MRQLKLDLSTFSGGDPIEWINRAEQFFAFYQIPEEQKLAIAAMHLTERVADRWFLFQHEFPSSWFGLTEFLMREFSSHSSVDYPVALAKISQLGSRDSFESIEEVYHFYNDIYAKTVGFSMRMGSNKRNTVTGKITWKQFVCSKEGKPDKTYENSKRQQSSTMEERNCGIKHMDCKARLNIVLNKVRKKWCISDFEEAHTHELTTPRRVHLLTSHRKLTRAKKCLMQKLGSVNILSSQQFKIMDTVVGGIEHIGCIARDLRNYERDVRQKLKGHDATMLLGYFESENEKNPSFYFAIDRDEENRMARCFWADPTSKKVYYFFNDVVVFDATYNKNKYLMIFAPITCVNNHG